MWRKFFLTILSIIFSLVFAIWLTIFNLKYFFFQPSFYKYLFQQSDFYHQIQSTIPSLLGDQINNILGIDVLSVIDRGELEMIVSRIITEDFLKTNIESAIDNVFGYFTDQQNELRLVISLGDLKERLKSEYPIIMRRYMESLPVCTEEQMQLLSEDQSIENIPQCIPPGIDREESIKILSDTSHYDELMQSIPEEELVLFDLQKMSFSETIHKLDEVRRIIKLMTYDLYLLFLIISAAILALIFMIAKGGSAKCKAVGMNLIEPGLGLFLISLLGIWKGDQLMATMMNSFGHSLPQGIIVSVVTLVDSLFKEIYFLFWKESLFLLGPGLLFFIVGMIMKNKENKQKEKNLINQVIKEEIGSTYPKVKAS